MADISKCPIGVFDSGLGGLTVFREIEKLLPGENIVYFGDTARLPYGGKSKRTIIRFSTENVLFLLRKRVKLVVVACNTSSSLALDYLKRVFNVPILGVVEAGVEKALKVSITRRIGVIGTKSTIASLSYQAQLLKADKNVTVYPKACPLFVPLVEEGLIRNEVVDLVVKEYLKNLGNKIDTLILGCTHYPLLRNSISEYLKGVYLVNSAREIAQKTRTILKAGGLLNCSENKAAKEFYVTDEPAEFMKLAKIFLRRQIKKPKVVSV